MPSLPGHGKELDSVSLDTGEKKYRTCRVCQGSGKVTAERSHFSDYPDVSLRKAQELMRIHGKPLEIAISDNDFTLSFKDNTRFILGGFAVGYRGTGPDFAKRFLDEAGFTISLDEIADMKPPLTLQAPAHNASPVEPVAPVAPAEEVKPAAPAPAPSTTPPIIQEESLKKGFLQKTFGKKQSPAGGVPQVFTRDYFQTHTPAKDSVAEIFQVVNGWI